MSYVCLYLQLFNPIHGLLVADTLSQWDRPRDLWIAEVMVLGQERNGRRPATRKRVASPSLFPFFGGEAEGRELEETFVRVWIPPLICHSTSPA